MSEPILWVHKHRPPARSRIAPNGDQVVEKFPNTAPPPEEHPLFGQRVRRWELMLDPQGNVLPCVYSGGASDYEGNHPQYGRQLRRRQRRTGWMPWGACPIALRDTGSVQPRHLSPQHQDRAIRPCVNGSFGDGEDGRPGPCPHMLVEKEFRAERNRRREASRMRAFQSEADKILAQNAENLAKQGEAQTELLSTVTELIKSLTGNGQWPFARPNMTPEEYAKAYHAAQAAAAAPQAAPAPAAGEPPATGNELASDDELERLMREADAAAFEDDPPAPPPPRKGRR